MSFLINPYAFGSSGPTDPNFSTVKLLLGFPGADGSTVFVDESGAAHGTATTTGSAQVDTAQSKFGGSSLLVAGASDGLTFPDSADWDLGSGNFTIDMFVRLNAVVLQQHFIGQWSAAGTDLGWVLFLYTDGKFYMTVSTDGTNTFNLFGATWSPSTGVWYHLRADFDGTKYRGYIDGVMTGSSTTLRTIFNSSRDLAIGGAASSQPTSGNFDEIRLDRGFARCGNDAGFTVPIAAYPRS